MIDNQDEFLSLLSSFENHNSVFQALASVGEMEIVEDKELGAPEGCEPTALVKVTNYGRIHFIVAETFWAGLTQDEKRFVVLHEMLHLIYRHPWRGFNLLGPDAGEYPMMIANIAADMIVNEAIEKHFMKIPGRFEKNAVTWSRVEKWVKKTIDKRTSFEELFRVLYKESSPRDESMPKPDPHDWQEGRDDGKEQTLSKEMSKQVPEKDIKKLQAGLDKGQEKLLVNLSAHAPKDKWERVVYEWLRQLEPQGEDEESWADLDRRHDDIPGQRQKEVWTKVNVSVFMDVSGSCVDMVPRIQNAIKSIPLTRFNIKTYAFDTEVKEIKVTDEIQAGGGTDFGIISKAVDKEKKHPDAVFVFTDGYGTRFQAAKPDKWVWFLTPSNDRSLIPKESTIYDLSNYE